VLCSDGNGTVDFREFLVKFSMADIIAQSPKASDGESSLSNAKPTDETSDSDEDSLLNGHDSDGNSLPSASGSDVENVDITEMDVEKAFSLFDIDGNGLVTAMDLVRTINR